jgi:hypothetical protein
MPQASRRALFAAMLAAAIAPAAAAQSGSNWDDNFRAFIKQLNRFIDSMEDGLFDAKQWKKCQDAWRKLDDRK